MNHDFCVMNQDSSGHPEISVFLSGFYILYVLVYEISGADFAPVRATYEACMYKSGTRRSSVSAFIAGCRWIELWKLMMV